MLSDLFSSRIVYVRLGADRLSLCHAGTQRTVEDVPILALLRTGEDKWKVAAFGQEAQMRNAEPDIHLMNAFAHQRPIIADVVLAQQTMKYFMRSLGANSIFSPFP